MKQILYFIACAIIITSISCDSAEENNNDNDNNIIENKLVKREYAASNMYFDYSYNSDNLLSKKVRVLPDDICIGGESNYIYDDNNNIIEIRTEYLNGPCDSASTYYSYDNNNRLIEISHSNPDNSNITFHYSGSSVEIARSDSTTEIIFLEINSLGLVSEVRTSENSFEGAMYSTLTYDNNGNLTIVRRFDNNDILLGTSNFSYDNNPNPFYGQLESLYLTRFLGFSSYSNFYGVPFMLPYGGYNFPFLKNNNINILQVNESTGENIIYDFIYNYDSENYPISVYEYIEEDNESFEFNIEYYE